MSHLHGRLATNAEIGLPRGHELHRVGGSVGEDLHIQPGVLEVSELVGNEEPDVIGVRRPIQCERDVREAII